MIQPPERHLPPWRCLICEDAAPGDVPGGVCDGCQCAVLFQLRERATNDRRVDAFMRAALKSIEAVDAAKQLLATLTPLEALADQAD